MTKLDIPTILCKYRLIEEMTFKCFCLYGLKIKFDTKETEHITNITKYLTDISDKNILQRTSKSRLISMNPDQQMYEPILFVLNGPYISSSNWGTGLDVKHCLTLVFFFFLNKKRAHLYRNGSGQNNETTNCHFPIFCCNSNPGPNRNMRHFGITTRYM